MALREQLIETALEKRLAKIVLVCIERLLKQDRALLEIDMRRARMQNDEDILVFPDVIVHERTLPIIYLL